MAKIFRTNFAEYDSEWVFLDREELRGLSRLSAAADVLEIKLDTIDRTEEAAQAIERAVGSGYSVVDWRTMNSGLFSALAIQQTTLFLVIGLIVAVSTFNIVATLVMTVQEKKRDIGVLSVMGAEPSFASRVFLWLGFCSAARASPPVSPSAGSSAKRPRRRVCCPSRPVWPRSTLFPSFPFW